MANEGEAAIGFSGKITLNGLLPSPGPVTRIAEAGDGCGAGAVVGVILRGAGFLGPPLMRGPLVTAEDGPVGLRRAAESADRASIDWASGLSERDSSFSGAGGFTAGVLKVFAAG